MSEVIREQVANILQAAGVTYSAAYVREAKNALGGNSPMDQWACAFERGGIREEFDFFTGLRHRKPDESPMARASAFSLRKVSRRMLAWEEHFKRYPDKPKSPHAADVLHSLILDSSAAHQSFADWCSDFGYDTDSRKALATYEACQENADKMRRVLTSETVAALAEALQDY